jgi:hypothetical protein
MWALLPALALAAEPDLEARLLGPEPEVRVFGPAPTTAAPVEAAVTAEPPADVTAPAGAATRSDDPLALLGDLDGALASDRSSPAESLPYWVPVLALAGAAAFYQFRRKTVAAAPTEDAAQISVLTRAALGNGSGLALVEVRDGRRTRRLLLGTGDKNPVLLSELDAAAPIEVRGDATPAPRPSRRSEGLSRQLTEPRSAPSPRGVVVGDQVLPVDDDSREARKAAAQILLDEALATRRTGPRAVQ